MATDGSWVWDLATAMSEGRAEEEPPCVDGAGE